MNYRHYLLISTLLALTACGSSSHRPVYSGRQESTEGVPGFSGGKKMSPYVKLGQSYTVDGETYVPRYQPDYVEEGMASWYGPGFHGGKTANGEEFDKHELTAAHRTLPLPSIVRVTNLGNGKSAYVRINDRGPFAKGRIIDLSYGAASEIGLIGKGVDRVRVEYMPHESQRFADLLAQGRDPKSIDLAGEVLSQSTTQYARAEMPRMTPKSANDTSWLGRLNPVSNAYAEEPVEKPDPQATHEAASIDEVTSGDLEAPPAPVAAAVATPAQSPFAAMERAPAAAPAPAVAPTPTKEVASLAPLPESTPAAPATPAAASAAPQVGKHYIQLGVFQQQANADRLRLKAAKLGPVRIESKVNDQDMPLYVVRMGPYETVEESTRVLAQLDGLGVSPKLVSK